MRAFPIAVFVVVAASMCGVLGAGAPATGHAPVAVRGSIPSGLTSADFDGNGVEDLAVPVPGEQLPTPEGDDEGAVQVFYAQASGLTADDNQLWHRGAPGVLGRAGDDRFGSALAHADFDADGYADLAVSAAFARGGGAVHVLRGSPGGLTADDDRLWRADSPGMAGAGRPTAGFGGTLASGDFNADGFGDLAVGSFHEAPPGLQRVDAGVVHVLHGSAAGLSTATDQVWHQERRGITGTARSQDFFGGTLASGDFDGTGADDLAITVLEHSPGTPTNTGAVHVLPGSSAGLSAVGSRYFSQSARGIPGSRESDNQFGLDLAAGDFGRSLTTDLAVSIPGQVSADGEHVGALLVLYGTSEGLSSRRRLYWDAGSAMLAARSADGYPAIEDLAAGDVTASRRDELAINAVVETRGVVHGAVRVFHGTRSGLSQAHRELWHQRRPGVLGEGDRSWGRGLLLHDVGRRGERADLIAPAPISTVNNHVFAGAFQVIYAAGSSGLTPRLDGIWHQDSTGVLDVAEDFDQFGS